MATGKKTRFLVFTGVFSAIAILLYFLEIPVIPGMNYLKIDFSDLPAALAGILLGPGAGAAVEIIKNLIEFAVRGAGAQMGFGNLMNLIVGVALVVPMSALARKLMRSGKRRPFSILLGGAAGLVCMAAAGVVGNYLLAPPFFHFMLHIELTGPMLWAAIGSATILNLIKPVIVTLLALPILTATGKYFAVTGMNSR